MLRADSQSPNQTRRNAARLLAAAARPRAWQVGLFERLEPRTFLDGTTVVDELSPESSTAGYLLDLAAGENTAPPPQEAAPATSTTTEATVVVVSQPTGDSTGTGETPASQPSAPARTPTTAAVRSPADFRYVLRPGSGWTGPTAQPPAVGDPAAAGYDAKAIARWDVVPYQTFDGLFHVGVVAFHMNGIDRVEFSVNGGDWTAVREMTQNPQTDVYEYMATLNASDFPDGPLEVRAIAWPTTGQPRVLAGEYDLTGAYQGTTWTGEHSLVLFANAGATLVDQVIELPAGDYTWGQAPLFFGSQADHARWLTYRPAPGVAREAVRIVGGVSQVPSQRNFSKIRLENITIEGGASHLRWFNNTTSKMVWFDGVVINGPGQHVGGAGASVPHQWWTNSTIRNSRLGMATQFIRNCVFENIGEDVIRSHHTVIKSIVNGVDSGPTDWHAGVFANPISHDNRIYYGNTITNIGDASVWPFRNGTNVYWENRDVAIVDCVTEGSPMPERHVWYFGAATSHLYVKDSQFTGRANWRTSGDIPDYWVFRAHNVVIENSFVGSSTTPFAPTPLGLPGVTQR